MKTPFDNGCGKAQMEWWSIDTEIGCKNKDFCPNCQAKREGYILAKKEDLELIDTLDTYRWDEEAKEWYPDESSAFIDREELKSKINGVKLK